jgi:uncharacterized repeat protein (TIGR01451 family)
MMKLFSRIRLPKVIASIALVAIALTVPLAATAADIVKFQATTGIANMTAGDTTYNSSVSAKYNETLKLQVTYYNSEDPSSNKTANNVHVKIAIPTGQGVNQTIATTTSADNVTTVNGSAHVTLDGADAYLQYIPGTAVWKHATTAYGPQVVEQQISDNVVTAADGVNLGNENPCQAGSVTVQVRVLVPGVSVDKYVRAVGGTFATSMTAKPGDTVQYEIAYKNTGNSTENNVIIRDNLPPNTTLVPGTTKLKNSTYPNGTLLNSDAVTTNGINITSYNPGAAGYVLFDVKMPAEEKLQCGVNQFRNVGIAKPEGMSEYYNTADVNMTKVCTPPAPTPTYTCDAFDITGDQAGKAATVSNFKQTTTNGATFANAVINWGDNTAALTTNNVKGQNHSYAADGTYTVSAVLHFTANGKDVTASGPNCSKTITFTSTKPPVVTPTPPAPVVTPVATTPVTLVNTGPGQVIGLFAVVAMVGAFAHRYFLTRRFNQN